MSKPNFASGQLLSLIERIENLTEDKKSITDDIKEVYAEAKANGFDPKIVRIVVARRAMERGELQEQDALLNVYLSALGELPLFQDGVKVRSDMKNYSEVTT